MIMFDLMGFRPHLDKYIEVCRKLWKCSIKVRSFVICFSCTETLSPFSLCSHHQPPGSHHLSSVLAFLYISHIICPNILKYSLSFWVTLFQKQSKSLNGVTVVILYSSPLLLKALDPATVTTMMWKHSKDRYLQLAWPPINKFFLCCPMNSVKKIDNPITFWRKIAIFVT